MATNFVGGRLFFSINICWILNKGKNIGFSTLYVCLSNTMASLTVSLFSCRWLLATSPDGHPSGVIKSFGEKEDISLNVFNLIKELQLVP